MKNFLCKGQYNNFVKATDKLSVEEIELLKKELLEVLNISRKRLYEDYSVFLCISAIDEDCNVTDFIRMWLENVFEGKSMINTKGYGYDYKNVYAREKFVKLTFEYLNNKTSL